MVNNAMVFQVEVYLGFLRWFGHWRFTSKVGSEVRSDCPSQRHDHDQCISVDINGMPCFLHHCGVTDWSHHHTQLSIIIKVTNTRFQKYTFTLPTLEILMMFMIRFLENNQTMQQYQLIPSETLINI